MTSTDPPPPFPKTAEFFVGLDSDGCAFDTMDLKHKECFIPLFIQHFGLASVGRFARETAEFVNLASVDRGVNRFPGYLKVLDLLATRPEIVRRGVRVPRAEGLRAWVARETRLANPALREAFEGTGDPDLRTALAWSEDVNRAIGALVRNVPPFPFVRDCLDFLVGRADAVVVSATPTEASGENGPNMAWPNGLRGSEARRWDRSERSWPDVRRADMNRSEP